MKPGTLESQNFEFKTDRYKEVWANEKNTGLHDLLLAGLSFWQPVDDFFVTGTESTFYRKSIPGDFHHNLHPAFYHRYPLLSILVFLQSLIVGCSKLKVPFFIAETFHSHSISSADLIIQSSIDHFHKRSDHFLQWNRLKRETTRTNEQYKNVATHLSISIHDVPAFPHHCPN